MTLSLGTRLGPYEILGPLGAGGMGEVYRARDTRLDRTVAIKVLPAHLADDPERRRRFEQEAHAVSSLSHPHICALYDLGHQDGLDFLVMEYLEGETVSVRLANGPLPLDQVLRYGIQIAEALDKAHRQGLTHRDLKPANIMLTSSGAKLLDFGLATAPLDAAAPAGGSVGSSSLASGDAMTGTIQYVSPEQLNGKQVDARSDIFALGAVLYEMATGRKAFDGETQASVIGAILYKDPPPIFRNRGRNGRSGDSPSAFSRVVNRCLAKDPNRRWQSARDVMLELEAILHGEVLPPKAATASTWRSLYLGWIVAAILAVVSLVLGLVYLDRAPAEAGPIYFSVSAPEKTTLLPGAAISPDGRRLVFRANSSEGRTMLWLRPLGSLTPQPLPETDGAANPFWSPDGRFIGFWAQGKLKKIAVGGPFSPPQTLCSVSSYAAGTWSRNGVILFSTLTGNGLSRVPAAGGVPVPVTDLDPSRQETAHLWPQFLPDGRHFLYLARSTERENDAIYAAALDSTQRHRRLVQTDLDAEYAPSPGTEGKKGHLLFMRGGTLMAQPFDAPALELSGEPFPVAEQVDHANAAGLAFFSVSANGVLTYRSGGNVETRLVWFDRAGKQLGTVGQPGRYRNPRLSPDDRQLAVERVNPSTGHPDVWVLDLARGTPVRLTFRPLADTTPVWSPDGARIVFASERDGSRKLYQKDSSGAGSEDLVLKPAKRLVGALDWSSDGRYVLYDTTGGETRRDLWVLPLFGDRKPFPFLEEDFGEYQSQFSPDGQRVAYTSDESSALEVYVQNFPPGPLGPGDKVQVSTNGGSEPQWRRDGKELFYLAPDRNLMAVEVKPGSRFHAGVPQRLFDTRINFAPITRNHYTVSADGRRFLFNVPLEETAASPLTVVVNWTAGRKR